MMQEKIKKIINYIVDDENNFQKDRRSPERGLLIDRRARPRPTLRLKIQAYIFPTLMILFVSGLLYLASHKTQFRTPASNASTVSAEAMSQIVNQK